MKLRDDYLMTPVGEGFVLVPVGKASEHFHGVARLNATAAFIVRQLDRDTTPDRIVDALLEEYDVDRAQAQAHVDALLNKLRQIGALEE